MFAANKDAKINTTSDDASIEANHLIDDMKSAVHEIKQDVHNAVSRSDWERIASKAGREARKLADTAEHDFVDARALVSNTIRAKPLQWSLIALSLGFVVGKLLPR